MAPRIDGYELLASLEPPHPRSTTSDPVFSARELATGNPVVIKVLSVDFPLGDQGRSSFLQHLKWAGQIDSPFALRCFAAGFTEDSQTPWFSMEPLQGEPLSRVLRPGRRCTPAQTKQLLTQAVHASVAALHPGLDEHLALEHLAITPTGEARCWNFGIAEWKRHAQKLVANRYTSAGELRWITDLTTEEARGGQPNRLDAAAKLALISFAMLTGRHYWRADNDPDASVMQLVAEVMAEATELPSSRAHGVALPRGYDAWFRTCTEWDFEDLTTAIDHFPG